MTRAHVLGLLVATTACTRPNPLFGDRESAGQEGAGTANVDASASDGSGVASVASATSETSAGSVADATSAADASATQTTMNGSGESGSADTGTTGGRIILFPTLAAFLGDAPTVEAFEFGRAECAATLRADTQVPCPEGGEVWGLLSTTFLMLHDYPMAAGGEGLLRAPVYAPDGATKIAASYAALVGGTIEAPLVPSVASGEVAGAGFWWGQSLQGVIDQNCNDWGSSDFGGEVLLGSTEPLLSTAISPCNEPKAMLCVCF